MKDDSLAFVFPGQGSQSVGMLAELAEAHAEVKATFGEASEALGYDLWHLVQQGPEADLNRTDITQPALLAAGVAVWRVWETQSDVRPAAMAGHSLGEYTALVCAEAIAFKDAVKLVEMRGRFMQSAVPLGEGAMAAVLGLEDDDVRAACAEAAQSDVVEAVNFNAPGQVVIAGAKAAVDRAIEVLKEKGAKRALPIPVSAPSHCALMLPAAKQLEAALAEVAVGAPSPPVLHNVDVAPARTADEIKAKLVRQLHSPVLWVDTIKAFAAQGVTRVIEAGPGKVLAGLNKRIDRTVQAMPVYDPASLAKALEEIK